MGSRITRTLYRNERSTVIKKQQESQLRQIITYFLSFLSGLYFFLHGYLYRPYLNNKNQIGVFLLLMTMFIFFKEKHIGSVAIWTNLLFLLATIINSFLHADLTFFSVSLIFISISFLAILCQYYIASPFFQAILTFIQLEMFNFGTMLSQSIEQLTHQAKKPTTSRNNDESLMVKVLFSIVTLLIVLLVLSGKKFLKKNQNNDIRIGNQIGVIHQIMHCILSFCILFCAFTYKRYSEGDLLMKLTIFCITLAILLISQILKIHHKSWIFILCLLVSSWVLNIVTDNEESLSNVTVSMKVTALNLMIINCIRKWISCIDNGNNKPFLVIFVCFSSFFLSELSVPGALLFQYFNQQKQILLLIDGILYAIFMFYIWLKNRPAYNQLPV